ncbi:MAG: hypothetical protein AAF495_13045 [Pseudomonadota bacterium]
MTNQEIYRSAQTLIEQYGREAPIWATTLADQHRDKGDQEGFETWERIVIACENLLDTARPPGVTLH